MEFQPFKSITRLCRPVIVTEKIDGTNGVVHVSDDGVVTAGSRSRWITPQDDNFGFAKWVVDHANELVTLGAGLHYGEWWGYGIQRGYGLKEKRFSLFNVSRWEEARPECCGVVPVLWRGQFNELNVEYLRQILLTNGSYAAPGYMNPEGFVVFHEPSNALFKHTLDGDGHKGAKAKRAA